MDIDIRERRDNPLMRRVVLEFEIVHEGATPARLSVRDTLAAMEDKDPDEVVVHELETQTGTRNTVGTAMAYNSSDDALEIEEEYVLKRNDILGDGSGD